MGSNARSPRTSLSWNVLLDLSSRRGALHERLASALREAIRQDRVPLGSALPPSRTLAADLGISRWTVAQAYTQLATEGYLEARTGSATRVRWAPDSTAPRPPRAPRQRTAPARYDMTPGRPDLRAFPARRWVEAIRQATASTPHDQLGYPDPEGAPALREVLTGYLNRARGAAARASDITVCLRAAEAMTRVCRALLADGVTHVAVEDPGWQPLGEIAASAGLHVVPVPVDAEGLQVDRLLTHSEVRAVCVAASHQFPTGAVLSPGRRAALLAWAMDNDGLIIEDDYDAEFRYDRPAVSTLQGMAPGRVFLLGSVSKTLAPAVGIGWVASPPRLTGALRAATPFPLAPPTIHQLALADFIESGTYDRHLRTARRQYRTRRRVLLEALASELPGCPVAGAAAGLHLLLWLPAGTDAGGVVTRAARRGLLVADLDRFRADPDPERPALVLGYGNLADSAAAAAISVLAGSLLTTNVPRPLPRIHPPRFAEAAPENRHARHRAAGGRERDRAGGRRLLIHRRLACVSIPSAVEISELVKRYGAATAVDGLTLTAARGAVTAILGPNGAGKTTTIEICEGYRRPDQGTVRVLGMTPGSSGLRPRVGVMLQSGGIPPAVPAADYLTLLSRFHTSPIDPATLLELTGLTSVARTPYKRLSGGQQQRLSLAAAVIGRPELVFLDEPTAGMDPQARHATWELIADLRTAGVSVILTTHFMDEAERLSDHVVIIDHGRMVAEGTPATLTGTAGQLRFRAEPGLDIEGLLTALPSGTAAKESPAGHYVVEVLGGAVDPTLLATVTAWCAERGVLANSLRIESRTLEDVFLELTGTELRA